MFTTTTTNFVGQPSITLTVPTSVTIRRKRNEDGSKDMILPDGSLYCRLRPSTRPGIKWQITDLQYDRPDAANGEGWREASIIEWAKTGEAAWEIDYRVQEESRQRAAEKAFDIYR